MIADMVPPASASRPAPSVALLPRKLSPTAVKPPLRYAPPPLAPAVLPTNTVLSTVPVLSSAMPPPLGEAGLLPLLAKVWLVSNLLFWTNRPPALNSPPPSLEPVLLGSLAQ